MPICGYDPLMGEGLVTFARGLAKSMRGRAERLSLSLSGQAAEEMDELFILTRVLTRDIQAEPEDADPRRRLEAFLAIVYLARYLMALDCPAPSCRADFDDRLIDRARKLDATMEAFERSFEELGRETATLQRVLHAVRDVLKREVGNEQRSRWERTARTMTD